MSLTLAKRLIQGANMMRESGQHEAGQLMAEAAAALSGVPQGYVMVPVPLLETAIEQANQMASMLWPQDHHECGPAQYVMELQAMLHTAPADKQD